MITSGGRTRKKEFEFNKDAGMFVCPAGNMAMRRARTGKKNQNKNQSTTFYFDIKKCRVCPLKDGYYKDAAKS